jgi:predicted DNA-binding transcriptional regulator YafY
VPTIDKEDRTRLERLVAIDERVSSNRYPTMRVLCQAFNVRPRTIYADIRLLRERFGLDIRFDRFRNGYYNASPGKRIPIGDLIETDYILLIAGCLLLGSNFGNKMQPVVRNVMSHMGKRLTFDLLAEENEFERMFIRPSTSLSETDPAVLAEICRALLQNRVVELSLDGSASPITCVPCSFNETANDGWQLLVVDSENAGLQVIDLTKITSCAVKDDQSKFKRKHILEQVLAGKI